ncbi:MarR family winged helix-turn-helix transcriptional regulator [Agromyces archimandritae]|uniref:Winged helix-turn-helix transcriptional regulator n=1 Tax=Agromyces archimandritae TaxID=2781962 RepID=A0A975FKH4_9MICO|nr:MarR family winged helix-turn-helix transcriptional regulator [Agromyces archimandritae]QTX03730.1 winged helix-turn-helix transcriptional regulator [Agromyces archimandritae]
MTTAARASVEGTALGGSGDVSALPAEEIEAAIVEVELGMNLAFNRARLRWKESAAEIAPELQPAGYKLLSYIARAGEANAHQLAEVFEMDKSVVSRQVRMLEELGLIVSRADEHDGRQRILTATPTASACIARAHERNRARFHEVLGELRPEELAAAAKVFRRMAES